MWHGIIGHDRVVEQFRRAIARGRLASSFLFAGPPGIGKRTFAEKFAQALLCERRPEQALDPCEQCPSCIQLLAGTHPDFQLVSKPEDKSFIPLEVFIGDREHRRREGLCHFIALKPRPGGRKIAVIDDADYLNAEGANSLLKTLEEPPPRSVLILIGASPARQLPTIRSRCQLIRFQPLCAEDLARLLGDKKIAANADEALRLARLGRGSIQLAEELADEQLWKFRDHFDRRFAAEPLDGVSLARLAAKFVEEAGKEPTARRRRLHQAIGLAADFYRRLLRAANGAADAENPVPDPLIEEAVKLQSADIEKTAARLERCLDADREVDRNANQSTLIEAWLDDMARA